MTELLGLSATNKYDKQIKILKPKQGQWHFLSHTYCTTMTQSIWNILDTGVYEIRQAKLPRFISLRLITVDISFRPDVILVLQLVLLKWGNFLYIVCDRYITTFGFPHISTATLRDHKLGENKVAYNTRRGSYHNFEHRSVCVQNKKH